MQFFQQGDSLNLVLLDGLQKLYSLLALLVCIWFAASRERKQSGQLAEVVRDSGVKRGCFLEQRARFIQRRVSPRVGDFRKEPVGVAAGVVCDRCGVGVSVWLDGSFGKSRLLGRIGSQAVDEVGVLPFLAAVMRQG